MFRIHFILESQLAVAMNVYVFRFRKLTDETPY